MNQSQFLSINCNLLKAREKSRVHGAIGLGFASHWLQNWRKSFKPIIKHSKRSHVITFDSHLKTALSTLVSSAHASNAGLSVFSPGLQAHFQGGVRGSPGRGQVKAVCL